MNWLASSGNYFVKHLVLFMCYKNKRKKSSSTSLLGHTTGLLLVINILLLQPGQAGRACLKYPCDHGICIDQLNSATRQCYCRNGFTGYRCEINWNECRVDKYGNSPCLNGGNCTDLVAMYNCTCRENFVGTRCEFDLSRCDEFFPCSNNGTCTLNPKNSTGLICNCTDGFTGDHCDDDISVCTTRTNPCQNGGTCIDGLGLKFTCSCQPGWTGHLCSSEINECLSDPCQNGGICIDQINKFSCACPFGFTGMTCETALKICVDNPCKNGAFCLEEDGKNVCYCVPDYHGPLCEERYDECEGVVCLNGGTCQDGVGSFNCSCPEGFYGEFCECSKEGPNPIGCDEQPESNVTISPTQVLPTKSLETYSVSLPTQTPTLSVIFGTDSYDLTAHPPSLPTGENATQTTSIEESISPSLNIAVSSSLATISIMSSEMQLPDLTDSLGSWQAQSIFPRTESEEPGSSRFSISSTVAQATSLFHEESRFPFSPSYEFEPSTWESFVTTKVIPPSETGVFQTGIPPEWESSEVLPSFETSYKATIFPSSQFPSESPGPPLESSFLPFPSLDSKSSVPFLSENPVASSEPQDTTIVYSEFHSEALVSTSVLSSPLFSTSVLQSAGPSESSYSFPMQSESESGFPQISYTIHTSVIVTGYSPVLTSNKETSTLSFNVSIETQTVHPPLLSSFHTDQDTFSSQSEFPSETSIPIIFDTYIVLTDFLPITSRITSPYSSYLTPVYPSDTLILGSTPLMSTALIESSGGFYLSQSALMPGETESIYRPYSSSGSQEDYLTISNREPSQAVPPEGSLVTPTPSFPIHSKSIRVTTSSGSPPISEAITPRPSPSLSSPVDTVDVKSTTAIIDEPSMDRSFGYLTPTISATPTTTVLLPTATPTPTLPTNQTNPCENYCQNNAKCFYNTIGLPFCRCPFKFVGQRCHLPKDKVKFPSFKGNSFLSYEVPLESVPVLDISTKLTTIVPDGIIMYSGTANGTIYAFIFLKDGLLTLHFSCGSQSMNFVETRTRVNNGFNFTLQFRMETVLKENNDVHCTGRLSVNDSYVMTGEQVMGNKGKIFDSNTPATPVPRKIFVGGIPPVSPSTSNIRGDQLLRLLPGFRGCMYYLSINQEERDMFDDAKDGREISECGMLACLVNPCFGNATCSPIDGSESWECICPPGFDGSRCQIPVCQHNSCQNGATCAAVETKYTNPNSTYTGNDIRGGSVCLCQIGFTGPLCQKLLVVEKPSFNPVGDHASFASYHEIPELSDWFQLKFHFVVKNMSQIGLLLYIGNERQTKSTNEVYRKRSTRYSRRNVRKYGDSEQDESDFFALSFLQGYIAVTWNLGTGARRIITPSRIDSRLGIHTLFVGRQGRTAWIKVDGMRNTTGKSRGPLFRLNVNTDLFIGGYDRFQFEGLPTDLPLHRGFHGCVFDLGFRINNKLYLPKITGGRHVKNCFEEDC